MTITDNNVFEFIHSFADTRSIATHPATSIHSKLTEEQRLEVRIEQGKVRLSIGLEHIDGILKDIKPLNFLKGTL